LFLMSLIYNEVWPIMKIIIGFILGFWVYGIWSFLYKKWFKTEWFILLWAWILINYIVILWWRYFLPVSDDITPSSFTPLLWVWITFLFLILNTIFSTLTSYIYSSKNLLLFSVLFAYFVPFLVWSPWTEISFVTLTWYSLLLSSASLFISNQKFKEWDLITSKILFYYSLILWNLVVYVAPISSGNLENISFVVKIIGFNLITFSNIALAFKQNFTKDVLVSFIIFWVLFSGEPNITSSLYLTLSHFLPIFITAFAFLFSSFYFSSKKNLNSLYLVWTLFTVLILLPILQLEWELLSLSVIGIVLFGIANYLTPFINKNLAKSNIINLVLWSVIWVLFLGWELYYYWKEYFPWITIGMWFLALAISYFVWWLYFSNNFKNLPETEKVVNINFIYTFLWIAISLFSISIALLFSSLPLVIVLIWIVEANVVLFFSKKLNSDKAFVAWIILLIIWLLKYSSVIVSLSSEMTALVAVWLIFASIYLNSYFYKNLAFKWINTLKILNIIWMFLIWISLMNIFNFESIEEDTLLTIIFLWIIWILNNVLKDNFLKISYIIVLWILFLIQSWNAFNMSSYYDYHYIFTAISLVILAIEHFIFKDKLTKWLYIVIGTYLFIISSIYLYHITNDYFSLTIYWWILALIWVHLWIVKSSVYIRWVGLYLLILILLKIVLYDVWNSMDNAIIRIVAFIVVGWIMIYISMLYSKTKLSLKDDFWFKKSLKS
jgi:hypothetical protein